MKRYVGSTIKFNKRKNSHLSKLKKNEHHSIILQNAWNKYGKENFEFIILEHIENKDKLIEREQWWIDNTPSQYNVCPVAGNCEGRKHTSEAKRKIGEYNKTLRKFSYETRKKISDSKLGVKRDSSMWKKQICQKCYEYDETGFFIKEWESIKVASDYYNIKLSTLRNSIYNGAYLKKNKKLFLTKKLKSVKPYINLKFKKVIQYDKNMNLIKEWNSIQDIIKELNLKTGTNISNCLNGRAKTAIGYIWQYK